MPTVVMQKWVQELGHRIGNSDLSMTGNTCTIHSANGNLTIEYEERTDSVHLWAAVANLPEDMDDMDYADLYEALLSENLTGTSTAGARFALDTMKNRILLCDSLSVKDDVGETFHALVPIMVKISEQWNARFNDTDG